MAAGIRLFPVMRTGVLVLLALAGMRPALADSYPSQPIRIIVGYAPGGNTDVPARLFATVMAKDLGVSIIVENRPGASGVPAAEYVRRSKPDGYTLLWATSASHSVSVVAMAPLPYDPIKDFAPVTLISEDPNVIVAKPDFPADSPKALLDYMKAHPGIPVGNSGPATSGRFAMELLKPKLGIAVTSVPYKSTGPLLTDLAGGQIPLGVMGESTAIPFLKDKRIRAYVVTNDHRSAILPDVPTVDEITGMKGIDAVAWSALYAPLRTPAAIVTRINAAMRQAAQAPEVKKWLDESGLEVPLGTPEEMNAFVQADIDRWVQVARDNHLTFSDAQ